MTQLPPHTGRAASREEIAIIGMSCRFPGGATTPAIFWRNLVNARDCIVPVPPSRWSTDVFYASQPGVPGRTTLRAAGFIEDPEYFDAEFFGLSPREVRGMDPQHRLALELAWTALEDANLLPATLRGADVGFFLGVSSFEYLFRFAQGPIDEVDAHVGIGNTLGVAAGRVSHVLGLEGPSMVIDTTCSSSLVSIHTACNALLASECSLALAGGVNMILSVRPAIGASQGNMLSPRNRCHVFDASADGFVRGEGGGLVVLKRLADARADGDSVYATILGSAVNQDGASFGLTVPSRRAQARVIQRAQAVSGIDPVDLGYIEAHGTGTVLGDPIEINALSDVFGPGRPDGAPLLVGSVKSNIGHLEAAAGAAGLIKATLAVAAGQIPPTINLQTLNPRIKWSETPVTPARSLEAWPIEGRRIAGVSSFGFSGTNAHVIIGQADDADRLAAPTCPSAASILTLSARSLDALRELAGRHAGALEESPVPPLEAYCSVVNSRRSSFSQRVGFVARDRRQLKEQLTAFSAGELRPGVTGPGAPIVVPPRVALVFTGQGSAYPGMARDLDTAEPSFSRHLDALSDLARPYLGASIADMLRRSEEALVQPAFVQPAMLILGLAIARLWQDRGVKPDLVLGHSLGEIIAGAHAGHLDIEEAIRFVVARGKAIDQLCESGGMVEVVGGERELWITHARDLELDLAASNAPGRIVFAGDHHALAKFCAQVAKDGGTATALQVERAFHSRLVEPAVNAIDQAATDLRGRSGATPWISTLTGEPISGQQLPPDYWRRQVREPVEFDRALTAAVDAGCSVFLEVGPHPALSPLIRATLGDEIAVVPSLRRQADDAATFQAATAQLFAAGVPINLGQANVPGVRAPTYPFQRKRYFVDRSDIAEVVSPAASTAYAIRWAVVGSAVGALQGAVAVLKLPGGEATALDRPGAFNGVPRLDFADLPARLLGGGSLTLVIPLWEMSRGGGLVTPAERARALVLWLAEFARLVGELPQAPASVLTLVVVTRGATQAAPEDERLDPAQASAWGAVRSLRAEYPQLRWRLLDLPSDDGRLDLSSAIVDELHCSDPEIALRAGRLAPHLVSVDDEATKVSPRLAGRCHVVTGASGALGRRVARWLLEQGASALVLNARNPDGAVPSELQKLADRVGAKLTVVAGSLARSDVCDGVVRATLQYGGVSSVFHCAGVLRDRLAVHLTAADVDATFESKVYGLSTLMDALEDVDVEAFVCFSSAAALLSSPGQSTYAAANAFMDAMMRNRAAAGRPGLALNWGPWADGGMASSIAPEAARRLREAGLRMLSPERAMARLASALSQREPQVLVCDLDWDRYSTVMEAAAVVRPAGIRANGASPGGRPRRRSATLAASLATTGAVELDIAVATYFHALLRDVTERGEQDTLESHVCLNELGFDSLMLLDVKAALDADLSINVPLSLLGSELTLSELTDDLVGRVRMSRLMRSSAGASEVIEI